MVADSSRPDANRVPEEKDSRPLSSRRLGVLISGRGSNLQSVLDAISQGRLDAQIAIVVSNRDDAAGLKRASEAGIETLCLKPSEYPGRDAYDRAMAGFLEARGVDLVCLAGFMRLVGPPLLAAFPNRMLNIHPSLLPAFPGLEAQRQALDYGVRVTGATVHLVTSELDGGPIVLQATVPVLEDDTVGTLSSRILVEEHRIYPEAIQMLLDGDWSVQGRRFVRGATAGRRPRA
jgi:phosphoribosylglycinamide formyltransferase 1